MEGSAYMGFGRGADGGARTTCQPRPACTTGPSLLDYRIPTSLDTPELAGADRRESSTPRARTAPRRRARGRCTRRSRRSPTRSSTRVGVRLRPPAVHARARCSRRCAPASAARAPGERGARRGSRADAAPARLRAAPARDASPRRCALLAETRARRAGPRRRHRPAAQPEARAASTPGVRGVARRGRGAARHSRRGADGSLVIGAHDHARRAGARIDGRARDARPRWPRPRASSPGRSCAAMGTLGGNLLPRHALPVLQPDPLLARSARASASRRTAPCATWWRAARAASPRLRRHRAGAHDARRLPGDRRRFRRAGGPGRGLLDRGRRREPTGCGPARSWFRSAFRRRLPGHRGAYGKLRERGSIDFPLLGVAARIDLDAEGVIERAELVLTALAARPRRVDRGRESARASVRARRSSSPPCRRGRDGAPPLPHADQPARRRGLASGYDPGVRKAHLACGDCGRRSGAPLVDVSGR